MSWLDPLGRFKWPSLILIVSPVMAYPFWLPEPAPAVDCGPVAVDGRHFRAFRAADGSAVILRPTSRPADAATNLRNVEPAGFDSGGMVVQGGGIEGLCSGSTRAASGNPQRP